MYKIIKVYKIFHKHIRMKGEPSRHNHFHMKIDQVVCVHVQQNAFLLFDPASNTNKKYIINSNVNIIRKKS
jgi:hypothetical protein